MAILATEKVLTLDYWKRAGSLVEGDYVFDRNGKIVRVKLVQNYQATGHRIKHQNEILNRRREGQ